MADLRDLEAVRREIHSKVVESLADIERIRELEDEVANYKCVMDQTQSAARIAALEVEVADLKLRTVGIVTTSYADMETEVRRLRKMKRMVAQLVAWGHQHHSSVPLSNLEEAVNG